MLFLLAAPVLTTAQSNRAQDDRSETGTLPANQENDPIQDSVQVDEQQDTDSNSGYGDAGALEGPDGVASELAHDDIVVGALLQAPEMERLFQRWFDAKRELNVRYGLQLQFSYQALFQVASESGTSESHAAGGRFQGQGMWTLLGRETKNPGSLSFRVEDRRSLGTEIAPTQLGGQFGSFNLTGTGFSDFQFALTELAWRQTQCDGQIKWVFGKISAVSWYNAHALSSSTTGFQNSSLQSSSSKPVVGRGLGGGAAFRLGEHFVLLGGVHDANARTAENPFESIGDMDFYYSIEFRVHPTSFERRRWDQIKVQAWYVDPTNDGATPSSHGVSFLASHLIDDFYMPFVVGGVSDGDATTIDADITVGVGFAFNTVRIAARDILGISYSWGNPSDGSLQDQFTTEVFYRFQLFQNLALTPAAQYIANPTLNPTEDSVWVAGLRMRMTF